MLKSQIFQLSFKFFLDTISTYELEKYQINKTLPNFLKYSPKIIENYKNLLCGELPNKYKGGVGGIGLRGSFLLLFCFDNSLGQEYKKLNQNS